jgi:hypothetical protein
MKRPRPVLLGLSAHADELPPATAPLLKVSGVAIFGGVTVANEPTKELN